MKQPNINLYYMQPYIPRIPVIHDPFDLQITKATLLVVIQKNKT